MYQMYHELYHLVFFAVCSSYQEFPHHLFRIKLRIWRGSLFEFTEQLIFPHTESCKMLVLQTYDISRKKYKVNLRDLIAATGLVISN